MAEPEIRLLGNGDHALLEALATAFAEAFDDQPNYTGRRPRVEYLTRLLGDPTFIALVALAEGTVVGGIIAYELRKFEQERSEIYLYDLAVVERWRRRRVATRLIEALKALAADRGAWVIFVQADTTADDQPAIALYSRLGEAEEVLHFDIPVPARRLIS
ncbi:MAG: AAC(3)-I family aminoglycoside N-acetyltransferase [Burkholderiales bacterium]|nr:AAC(3)-I family aminoglycoside N-acetyltransferase [Burkholderiales bacterium]